MYCMALCDRGAAVAAYYLAHYFLFNLIFIYTYILIITTNFNVSILKIKWYI